MAMDCCFSRRCYSSYEQHDVVVNDFEMLNGIHRLGIVRFISESLKSMELFKLHVTLGYLTLTLFVCADSDFAQRLCDASVMYWPQGNFCRCLQSC